MLLLHCTTGTVIHELHHNLFELMYALYRLLLLKPLVTAAAIFQQRKKFDFLFGFIEMLKQGRLKSYGEQYSVTL